MRILKQNKPKEFWDRAIVFIDMNAFFASIEQMDFPWLKGRPVVITNGDAGTTIITCSYEARRYGIHTGIKLKDALALCPSLIRRPSRPKRYSQVSTNIMQELLTITPDVEIFSVDEAFLDVTRCQRLFGSPRKIGLMTQQAVFKASSLLCSIGISGDKTTAKLAGKEHKPNGFNFLDHGLKPSRKISCS